MDIRQQVHVIQGKFGVDRLFVLKKIFYKLKLEMYIECAKENIFFKDIFENKIY